MRSAFVEDRSFESSRCSLKLRGSGIAILRYEATEDITSAQGTEAFT